ncbi:MAG TPA: glycosyltransferase [Syntrophorhabdales bacterium]|nr:glycosyltransferase [Syntrophorhabdales bacterium]
MRFSILLPTRDRLNLLKYAIETVIKQDYADWEVIVSDNCSNEDVAGYVQSLADQRIKYYRTDRFLPVTENWNNALHRSTGDYFIMLGDDDCLMRGCLSALHRLINEHNEPDFIYMRAFLYAYPGVFPDSPDGFLQTNGCAPFFVWSDEPFFLERSVALNVVHMSMDFRLPLEYNMQYSVVKKKFADTLDAPFFQPPYPDYYATTALFLKGSRILICPTPLVTIGISPKSFGFFYYNDHEEQGVEFLNNLSVPESLKHLEPLLLPGSNMNTSWLLAMETIRMNYDKESKLRINYRHYRSLQVLHLFQRYYQNPRAFAGLRKELLGRLSPTEQLWYRMWLNLTGVIAHFFGRKAVDATLRLLGLESPYPAFVPYRCPSHFQNILEVFERVTPELGLAHACKPQSKTRSGE